MKPNTTDVSWQCRDWWSRRFLPMDSGIATVDVGAVKKKQVPLVLQAPQSKKSLYEQSSKTEDTEVYIRGVAKVGLARNSF